MAVFKADKHDPKSLWRFEIQRNGKRHTRSGFKNKKDAKAAQAEELKRLDEANTEFAILCDRKLADIKVRSKTDEEKDSKHYKECKAIFTLLKYRWRGKKQVSKADIVEFLTEIADKSKPKANKFLRRIRSIFNYGVENDLIIKNPCKGIKQYGVQRDKKYIPSEEDIRKVLAVSGKYKPYLLLIIHTLARVREINNLKWEDIHDDHLTLRSRKSKHHDEVPRDIPLNSVLKEVIESIPPTKIKDGNLVTISPFLFVNVRTGKNFDYRDKFLPTLCKKAGVKPFMFHALRHFGASLLSKQGTALTDIQNILGHSRATTTDIYLQSIKGSVAESMKKLEGIR